MMSQYTRMDTDSAIDDVPHEAHSQEPQESKLDPQQSQQPPQVIVLLAPVNKPGIGSSAACQACVATVTEYPWKSSLGLAISEVSLAAVSIIVNIIGQEEYTYGSAHGPGIWSAVLVAAAGVMGILASCKNIKGLVMSFFVLSILGSISATVLAILAVSYLVPSLRWGWTEDIIINGLYLGVGVAETVITVITGVLAGRTIKSQQPDKEDADNIPQPLSTQTLPTSVDMSRVLYLAQPMMLVPANQDGIKGQGLNVNGSNIGNCASQPFLQPLLDTRY